MSETCVRLTKLTSATVALVASAAFSYAAPAGATAATESPQPDPNWSLSGSANTASNSIQPADTWECAGTAFTPSIVTDAALKKYVYYSGKQTCFLDYNTNQVCVKLQEEDSPIGWRDLSTTSCSALTANSTITYGRTLSCSVLGRWSYRTAAYGIAHYGTRSGWHYSASATLC